MTVGGRAGIDPVEASGGGGGGMSLPAGEAGVNGEADEADAVAC